MVKGMGLDTDRPTKINVENIIMITLVVGLVFIAGITSDKYKEFSQYSNGNSDYRLAFSDQCNTGEHGSGCALAPVKFVMLKQKNHDGTIGSICPE